LGGLPKQWVVWWAQPSTNNPNLAQVPPNHNIGAAEMEACP
jgi:primase-polymerase (primpol)-like protein